MDILYLEGGGFPKNPNALPTDEDVLDLKPGFNLVLEPMRPLVPGCSDCGAPVGPYTLLAPDAAISIDLTGNPSLSRDICQRTGGEGVGTSSACEPCIGDACAACSVPANANVICSADKTAYVAKSCVSQSLCSDLECQVQSGRRDATAAAPANWPCP